MKAKIFSFVKIYDTSIVASVRIARMLSEELQAPIVVDDTVAETKLDVLVIVNGAYAFCQCLPALGKAIEEAKRVVWIQNDYTIIPPKIDGSAESPFRKAFVNRERKKQPRTDFWTTCADWQSLTPGSCYVNWNCLTFDPKKPRTGAKDVYYYGSYRAGRERYFDRYFTLPVCQIVVSSPSRKDGEPNEKFSKRYPNVTHVPKAGDLGAELARHGLGLYLEDRKSHERFHSPSNRFYEMLSAGLPIVFQPESGTMMRRGGYDPTPFSVSNSRELAMRLEKRDSILREQRGAWFEKAEAERRGLPASVQTAWKKLRSQL